MDPDVTLDRMRELCAKAQDHLDRDAPFPAEELQELVTYFEALDAWMVKGGFKPAPWCRRDV